MRNNLSKLKELCGIGKISTAKVIFNSLIYKILYKKNIYAHPNVKIFGIRNISAKKRVLIGLRTVNFAPPSEKTMLNIEGQLVFKGTFSIGKGCKIDVREGGVLEIGKGGYLNSYSKIIVAHKLRIGDNCAISWDCQFLDEDFHTINYVNKKSISSSKKEKNEIHIGNDVWIGCGVKIYKGSSIADGCVVASDTIVKGKFTKENCLIGGHPAKVLKEEINWK